ncbi:MAG: flavin reductase family protein, partial [Syntrophales bacterium]
MNRKALHSISYGLYIVSSTNGERINGQIANSVFQVTSEPQTIAVSINKENLTHSYIQASRTFSISILSRETPSTLIGRFGFRSGRDIDKFDGMKYKRGITGAPIALDFAIAYIEVNVTGEMDCGTHTIF